MINGDILRDAIISAANNLANNRKQVDDLNVFPVPDGDTGTNMTMTIMSAARMVSGCGEDGTMLSGGQKQRLSIARAFLSNPEVLLLDDSLSAVDGSTEATIVENLKRSRQGKTTFIVAHRLSAVRHADVIVVMENGKIVDQGNHDELISHRGWYYEQYQNQILTQEEVA